MELSQQVTSLELSKQLKELGVKQDSYFYWLYYGLPECKLFHAENDDCNQHSGPGDITFLKMQLKNNQAWSAFTVAELGEMLPFGFMHEERFIYLNIIKEPESFILSYDLISNGHHEQCYFREEMPKEADARAKMLIYLIENNLMEIPK